MLGERALGRGEDQEPVFGRPLRKGERKADRGHLIARAGRGRLDKAKAIADAKGLEGLRSGNRSAEKGGIGDHGKS